MTNAHCLPKYQVLPALYAVSVNSVEGNLSSTVEEEKQINEGRGYETNSLFSLSRIIRQKNSYFVRQGSQTVINWLQIEKTMILGRRW